MKQVEKQISDLQKENDRLKTAFLHNISHEIRTPMNAVIGMTHLALQTEMTDQQRNYLQKSKAAAGGLLGLINDILDFSKIEAGKLEMDSREFLLTDVYEQVTQLVGLRATEKNLEFMLDTAPEVPVSLVGDPLRLAQVLTNLCSNAVKFTEQGEIIVITFLLVARGDDAVTLQFSVRDTGIGIVADKQQLVFMPFRQADGTTTRRFGGTGLGLSISSHLVHMMSGRIWMDSEVGRGTTVHFTARFGLSQSPSPHPSRRVGSKLAGLTALVVDDNTTNRLILERQLRSWQILPTLASSAHTNFLAAGLARSAIVFSSS